MGSVNVDITLDAADATAVYAANSSPGFDLGMATAQLKMLVLKCIVCQPTTPQSVVDMTTAAAAAIQAAGFLSGLGLGMVADQLKDLKLGELLDTPPPGLDEAVAIAKVVQFVNSQVRRGYLLW